MIKDTIREKGLDRIIVASCSPVHHGAIFSGCIQDAGLNPYMWDMANIREQCSWVHHDPGLATEKAYAIIKGAINRVRLHEPIGSAKVPMVQDVLVIGAGITGIHTAIELGDKGFKVALIEKDAAIGGNMVKLDRTLPTDDCSMCTISPILNEVSAHENVEIYTMSEVTELKGRPGEFYATVHRRPRFIDEEKCTGCGDCATNCLVSNIIQLRETESVTNKLDPEMRQRLDEILDKYTAEEMSLIPILQDINDEFNYLPKLALKYISERLDVSLGQIYHVATFYNAFSLTPRGEHLIKVCLGTACHVRGGARVLSELERKLEIKPGETTKDLKFTLETVNCLGACALGPVVVIDNEYHPTSPAKIKKILKKYEEPVEE